MRRSRLISFAAGMLTFGVSIHALAASGVLHTFKQKATGFEPAAQLVEDSQGNFYGTTVWGGNNTSVCQIGEGGCGTVFELSANGRGGLTYSLIYKFQGWPNDGANPTGGLILDSAGNLYGTTGNGGTHSSGTVFELSKTTSGGWTDRVLYSFSGGTPGGTDGLYPIGRLTFTAGNLYGVTQYGGASSYGTVFELSPGTGGDWTENVLYSFPLLGGGVDGYYPQSGLLMDKAGNLYGATYYGGASGLGTLFELSQSTPGTWTESVLYSFTGLLDGYGPGSLIFDGQGNIYGTAQFAGGVGYQGAVFKFSPSATGWTEQTLYAFNYDAGDGGRPMGVVLDSAGNLYGSTFQGGTYDWGILYRLTESGGVWHERVLHTFGGEADGGSPLPLIMGQDGNLYGVTAYGGAASGYDGFGIVFKVAP